MSYLIEREQAFLDEDLVAVVRHRRRAVRSQLVFRDGSLRYTLTRPRTLIRRLQGIATQHFEGEQWPSARQPNQNS